MPRQLLTIEVSRVSPRHALLRLTGELDFDTAPELIRVANQVHADGHDDLTIDLTDVTLCDSSGLSAFVVIYRCGARSVHLTGMNQQIRLLLERTGLAELLATPRGGVADGIREVG